MQSSQRWLPVSTAHEGASAAPPLDELLASIPWPPPSEPEVDASAPPEPPEKGAPPQSDGAASETRTSRRAEARRERRITKPA